MKPFNRNLVFSLTLVFLSGLAVGAFAYRYHAKKTAVIKEHRPPRSSKDFRAAYMAEMTLRLKLTGEQLTRLNAIRAATEAKFKAVRDRTRPEMKAIQDGQVSDINAMLTQDQKSEYEKMRKEREERRKKREAEQGKKD